MQNLHQILVLLFFWGGGGIFTIILEKLRFLAKMLAADQSKAIVF